MEGEVMGGEGSALHGSGPIYSTRLSVLLLLIPKEKRKRVTNV